MVTQRLLHQSFHKKLSHWREKRRIYSRIIGACGSARNRSEAVSSGGIRAKKDPRSCVRNASAGKKIPGAVLLSHSQIYSTIAAGALNCRVREGNVCFCSAISTGKKSNSIKYLYWRDPLQRFNNSPVRVNSFPRASLRKPSEKRWLSLTAD